MKEKKPKNQNDKPTLKELAESITLGMREASQQLAWNERIPRPQGRLRKPNKNKMTLFLTSRIFSCFFLFKNKV
ncbi:MAG: hypothetical protein ABIG60_04945 [Patescibacteria group bacterium]